MSALLNLMHHCKEPKPQLTGILWMIPMNALSLFYHVPVPDDDYPLSLNLGFLTLGAFIANWIAWFSRIESYMVLGTSRFLIEYISSSVAACTLRPLILGCGQTPLMDLFRCGHSEISSLYHFKPSDLIHISFL
ncbi:hypothetical protein Aperf_G00000015305 [Anoplocephala perfoliata]